MKLDWVDKTCLIILTGLIIFLVYCGFQSPAPNSSVIKAAESITPSPSISNGRFALFTCSHGDFYRFDVSDKSGKYSGYVCQGLFFKGATARY